VTNIRPVLLDVQNSDSSNSQPGAFLFQLVHQVA